MLDSSRPGLFIFIGRSGCGKGTQAALLKEHLAKRQPERQWLQIETGKLFRDFVGGSGHSSQLAKRVMEQGGREPDWLAVWNWARVLVADFTGRENIILDGAPRSLLEAQALDTVCQFYNLAPTIIYLNLSPEKARERLLKRSRSDDQDNDAITKRLTWFDEEVMPAVEHFRRRSLYRFLEIDGAPAIEAIHQAVIRALENNNG